VTVASAHHALADDGRCASWCAQVKLRDSIISCLQQEIAVLRSNKGKAKRSLSTRTYAFATPRGALVVETHVKTNKRLSYARHRLPAMDLRLAGAVKMRRTP
jgi:hypothetical protein